MRADGFLQSTQGVTALALAAPRAACAPGSLAEADADRLASGVP